MTASLILTIMILPIMVALSAGALATVPPSWREGSAALGVNRWRTIWRVSLRTARPAIAAATVLATARALGEAIMLAMVSGGRPFAANPLDGLTFLFEPVQPLAATIVQEFGGADDGPGRAARSTRSRSCCSSRRASCRSPAGRSSSRSSATGSASDGHRGARRQPRPAGDRPSRRATARPRGRCSTGSATGPCWATGIGLCLIAAAIVLFMFVKGISSLRLNLFVESPAASLHQSQSGGFLDPIIGTLHRDGRSAS